MAAAKIAPPDERHEQGLPMLTPDAEDDLPPPPPVIGGGGGGGDEPPGGSAAPPPGTPYTDLGNAERFVEHHAEDLRFCADLGGWQAWTGSHWARDEKRIAQRRAHLTARQFHADVIAPLVGDLAAAADPQEEARLQALIEAAEKWATVSESAARLGAMVSEARNIPPIPIAQSDFDDPRTHLWLNCPNGTLNLETMVWHSHRRADLITKCTSVAYDATALAPTFHRFLEEVLPDEAVRAYVQRWAGYVATGVIREHVLPVWHGKGANGKGTLAEVLKAVLGSYAIACPEGFFEDQKNQQHATEIARLRGARLAIGSETRESSALAESKIKRLTGGDTLTGRWMRGDFFDFRPTTKFVLFTNHKPEIHSTDDGIRRRVTLVPFDVVIPPDRRDPLLPEKLVEESPGILRWIVEGCAAWRESGWKLDPPASIQAATTEYLAAEDAIARFLVDACTVTKPGDPSVKSEPAHLHNAFREWAAGAGEKAKTQRAFLEALGQRGFSTSKSNGRRWVRGVAPTAAEDGNERRAYHD